MCNITIIGFELARLYPRAESAPTGSNDFCKNAGAPEAASGSVLAKRRGRLGLPQALQLPLKWGRAHAAPAPATPKKFGLFDPRNETPSFSYPERAGKGTVATPFRRLKQVQRIADCIAGAWGSLPADERYP
jgi:hypothetical protein